MVTRVGDETVGEMWSLYDGRDVLNEIDPQFATNIARHIHGVIETDVFHVSANTDPKGDRSKPPQEQDPDMMVHVGQGDRQGHHRARGEVRDRLGLCRPGVPQADGRRLDQREALQLRGRRHRQDGRAGREPYRALGFRRQGSAEDYPLSNSFDEVDFLMVLDNVLIPWEDVFFYQHTRAAQYIRGTLHRYSAFPYTLRVLYMADMMIGAALWNAKQTGLDKLQAVREKLADLVCYREGINAHLTAAIALAQPSPGGLLMPHQSILYAGRIHACSNLPQMMHIARELCGGQICVTPNVAAFDLDGSKQWLEKFYSLNSNWQAEDRRKLLAFARDLLNSDYAGHRLTFVQFAQAPALQSSGGGLQRIRFLRPARFRAQRCRPVR